MNLHRTFFAVIFVFACSAAAADIDTVRQRLVDSLLPKDDAASTSILQSARNAQAAQKPDGSWADIDYTDQARSAWKLQQHLERALLLAKADELNRQGKRADDSMGKAALRAVDWWTAHDPKNPNWWWNEIGTPQFI